MTATALATGYAADLLLGDPRRGHPVAAFGTLAARAERVTYAPGRAAGTLHAAGLVAAVGLGVAALGSAAERIAGRHGRAAILATTLWAALGGRSLNRAATRVANAVAANDLDAARATLPWLCGRDPHALDADGLRRAALESVAENTSDAVVASLLWGALLGAPGVAVHRAANTLDAMVGHRSERYRDFGWAAARLDDLLNWPAARLTAALAVLCAPAVGGSPRAAARAWRDDGPRHPSPNAGPVEAAFAGALGVTLGGPLAYAGVPEDRARLGSGPAPGPGDVERAIRLARLVSAAAAFTAAALRTRRRTR